MSGRLEGKKIIVTAAGQGIGKATAIAFHNDRLQLQFFTLTIDVQQQDQSISIIWDSAIYYALVSTVFQSSPEF